MNQTLTGRDLLSACQAGIGDLSSAPDIGLLLPVGNAAAGLAGEQKCRTVSLFRRGETATRRRGAVPVRLNVMAIAVAAALAGAIVQMTTAPEPCVMVQLILPH